MYEHYKIFLNHSDYR